MEYGYGQASNLVGAGCEAAPKRQPEIWSELDQLEKALGELRDRFNILSERINPILGARTPQPAGENKIHHGKVSAIGSRIYTCREAVNILIQDCSEVTALIEL